MTKGGAGEREGRGCGPEDAGLVGVVVLRFSTRFSWCLLIPAPNRREDQPHQEGDRSSPIREGDMSKEGQQKRTGYILRLQLTIILIIDQSVDFSRLIGLI